MRQETSNRVLLDEEGFPASPVRPSSPSVSLRDSENGEVVGQKVVTLRRPPEEFPRSPRLSVDSSMGPNQPSPYSLLREHQRFSGFRVKDALAQRGSLRLRKGAMTYIRRPAPLPQYQMCLTTRERMPATRTFHLKDLPQVYGRWDHRPCFRVPRESLSNTHSSVPKDPNAMYVNIWEEFLLGTGAHKSGKCVVDEQAIMLERLRKFLEGFLSTNAVNYLMFTLYFMFFFVSCLTYNNYMEIIGYMLFHGHLKLHECAYDNNVDLNFTGSLFQGPAYAWIRGWCQHCIQKENAKVFENLMKKMKSEILTARDKIT